MEKPVMMENKNKEEKAKPEKEKAEKITLPKAEHERLLEQVKELEAVRDRFLRSAADYDNARKRLAKEREEFVKFSQEKLLRDLLPILDNLDRAMTHALESTTGSGGRGSNPLLAGVQLIWKQFLGILAAHGLKRFSSEGEPFDPHLHEAVEEVQEDGPEGRVVKELVAGYLLHDRILRPAKVRIRVSAVKKGKPLEEKQEELT